MDYNEEATLLATDDYEELVLKTLYTTDQVADLLKVHPVTLRQWRVDGIGPFYLKVGRAVRYRHADLAGFITVIETTGTL